MVDVYVTGVFDETPELTKEVLEAGHLTAEADVVAEVTNAPLMVDYDPYADMRGGLACKKTLRALNCVQ